MSAYIVSDATMQCVVAELVAAGFPSIEASYLGRKLWALNTMAVRGRYGTLRDEDTGCLDADKLADTWRFTGPPTTWEGPDAVGELHYQCAEDPAVHQPLYVALAHYLEVRNTARKNVSRRLDD